MAGFMALASEYLIRGFRQAANPYPSDHFTLIAQKNSKPSVFSWV
jgi:hypothetical protein